MALSTNNIATSTVGINVGGTVFLTTLSTLASLGPNLLTTMISRDTNGTMSSTKDNFGNYFVDRNGRYFEYILDYLRTGQLYVPPAIPQALIQFEHCQNRERF
eukprot:TRINITY_DN4653_c0_g1_i1.p1 TRINITY_DN4653_c0_g1~~TRINITY_DN4653_c0_g1_i1.p1  ORF type:complete len:110 (-),score=7.53 TRINITY_DN4653_c0_g1_i1:193-501(-)